jgi:SAM-dependent methyltransferase
VDWVQPFFDTAATWWGRPEIRDVDRERAAAIERFCGPGPKRVLELGAGGGATAAATADCGHRVTAVELSPVRAGFARALAVNREVKVVEGDFSTVDLDGRFDWRTGTASVLEPTPTSAASCAGSPPPGWRRAAA